LSSQSVSEFVYGYLVPRTDIEHTLQRRRRTDCEHVGARHVANMDEITGLPTIAENYGRLPSPQAVEEA
jgi:hypothetical protein